MRRVSSRTPEQIARLCLALLWPQLDSRRWNYSVRHVFPKNRVCISQSASRRKKHTRQFVRPTCRCVIRRVFPHSKQPCTTLCGAAPLHRKWWTPPAQRSPLHCTQTPPSPSAGVCSLQREPPLSSPDIAACIHLLKMMNQRHLRNSPWVMCLDCLL